MKRLVVYYNFILVITMAIIGFVGATSYAQLVSATIFFPLAFYFTLLILPQKRRAINIPTVPIPTPTPSKKKTKKQIEKADVKKISDEELKKEGVDIDRRAFIKLIGTAGVTVFLFALFTKRAQGAFFGSVPGPGIVGIKDASDTRIDPAQHHPTDGYKLAELDDSTPAYYGFTRADGMWFIIREGSGGDFRYTSGTTDFNNATTGWPNRAALTFNYYDVVF